MPSRLITSLRDVLFENTPETPVRVSIDLDRGANSAPALAEPEVDAARTAIHAAIEPAIGPGVREYSLQDSALAEALPESAVRRRAILRVLSAKGVSREQLGAELEHVLAAIGAQTDAFSRKLLGRRSGLESEQREAAERSQQEIGIAENEIARLEAELAKQRNAIAESRTRRDQLIAASQEQLAELTQRERGFERALRETATEYQTLKTQLGQEQ